MHVEWNVIDVKDPNVGISDGWFILVEIHILCFFVLRIFSFIYANMLQLINYLFTIIYNQIVVVSNRYKLFDSLIYWILLMTVSLNNTCDNQLIVEKKKLLLMFIYLSMDIMNI
jgi:hypothetical protein